MRHSALEGKHSESFRPVLDMKGDIFNLQAKLADAKRV